MVLTTNRKGAIAETAIAAAAVEAGIYRPVVEGGRFDLVFGLERDLKRVQCKWAVRQGDARSPRLRCSRHTPHGYVTSTYDAEEVDLVAAYCREMRKVYLLPSAVFAGRTQVQLRLAESRNNQAAGIHWAAKYELGAIAQLGERRRGTAEVAGSSPASSTSEGRPRGGLRAV